MSQSSNSSESHEAPHAASRAEEEPKREGERGASRWTWIVPLVLVALLVLLYFLWPAYQQFVNRAVELLRRQDRQELQAWVLGFGAWGPLLILALMIAQALLAFLPSVVVMVVAVLGYGPWWGGLLAWAGLLVAATVAYLIGRALGPVTVDRLVGEAAERKVSRYVERYGIWAIVAARISPALSNDAVSYAAGLVRMRYWHFALATALGTLPLTAFIAYLGEDIARLQTGLIWVSVVSVVLFVAYVIYDHVRHQGTPEGESG